MKAVVLTAYGEVDKLVLRDVPEPEPGPSEVKVKVAAASINAVDWKLRSGALQKFMPLQLPAILGRDVSGTVVKTGPGVTGFKAGDKVLGLVHHGYAEYVVEAQEGFAQVPDGLDLRAAAALPLVVLTGAQLIEEATKPRKGELVLVTGAVGGVGRAAVYAASKLGARVIAGVRAKQKAEAQKLGAEKVVALDDEGEVSRLPELDAVADTVGGETIEKILLKIRKGGAIGSVVGEPAGAKGRDLRVKAMLAHPDSTRLRELAGAVARGELDIPVEKPFPLARASEAQELAEEGGVGKILLVP
jgi:NADPH:quinone reductase-like Zn-dependent oxidoreductase